ncbi:MAG: hypothetical protein ACKV2T_04545 [Kofleriaceae bacterium]
MAHRWHFFRAGGVDQVSLRDGKDLLALKELDQKLWVALAMPVKGVDIDAATLTLIDKDTDGRIRVADILETVDWLAATFKSPEDILKSANSVKLAALKDDKVLAAAKLMLKDLGKADAKEISVADSDAITKAFTDTVLNGDGVVIPESTKDEALKKLITEAIAAVGSVPDRSSKPGLDKAKADELFAEIDKRAAWITKGKDAALAPLGDGTGAAHDAFVAVRDKLEDYFTRAKIASYDARGATTMGGLEADLVALSQKSLSAKNEDLAKLPLAKIDATGRLPMDAGLNPAWAERMATFVKAAVTPILGARPSLTVADLTTIADKLAGFAAWRADEAKTKVDGWDSGWVLELSGPDARKKLADLIAEDAALTPEYDQIASVAKAVRLQRDGARILRNFVNFSDFYSQQDGAFQAGTLYIDARALHLVVPVADPAKHAALAAASDAFLAYCDITRKGETRQIAVAVTNGDSDNLFVGRNGVFYDREGNDWDATITKLVSNPISIREAFWSPYKKLVKAIEDTVQKRAAAADAEASAKMTAAGSAVGSADKAAAAAAAAPPPAPAAPKKIDLGTVAAIGVAIGGIGTLVGALLAVLFGLGKWLPIGIVAILLLISGPAMLLAFLKLRRRNLGPILDANGWAVNGRARINVAFGAAMTELAKLPKGAQRSLDDPFADKRTPWKRWVFLIVLLVLGGMWYVGKLDKYLPFTISSENALGDSAPIVKARKEAEAKAKPAAPAAPAAPAPAPAPAP